jgi:hypothetical protein
MFSLTISMKLSSQKLVHQLWEVRINKTSARLPTLGNQLSGRLVPPDFREKGIGHLLFAVRFT